LYDGELTGLLGTGSLPALAMAAELPLRSSAGKPVFFTGELRFEYNDGEEHRSSVRNELRNYRSAGYTLLPELVNVIRWLSACTGCGMCQEACQTDNSLAMILLKMGRAIRSELHYGAGDPSEQLPWT
jgi:Fe-S oxidoreductase